MCNTSKSVENKSRHKNSVFTLLGVMTIFESNFVKNSPNHLLRCKCRRFEDVRNICYYTHMASYFRQSMALAVLVNIIPFSPLWGWETKEQFASGMQDLLICLGMWFS